MMVVPCVFASLSRHKRMSWICDADRDKAQTNAMHSSHIRSDKRQNDGMVLGLLARMGIFYPRKLAMVTKSDG